MTPIKQELSLKWIGRVTAGMYIVALIASVAILLIFENRQQGRLARSYSRTVRESIVLNDLRSAAASLQLSLTDGFSGVVLLSSTGEPVFELPNRSTVERIKSNSLTISIPTAVYRNRDQEAEAPFATIVFYYSGRDTIFLSALAAFVLYVLAQVWMRFARQRLEERYTLLLKEKRAETMAQLATQVAHDIRSPVSALNAALRSMEGLPEDSVHLVRRATDRINDIANDLLKRNRINGSATTETCSPEASPPQNVVQIALPKLLTQIVMEKRLETVSRPEVTIDLDLRECDGVVCMGDEAKLLRILSNLLNNGIEAITHEGRVLVALRVSTTEAAIVIMDNGRGIPEEILVRLGHERLSVGKENSESGSGLGVYHARQTIEAMNGHFSIQSKVGMGTTITIRLPRASSPDSTAMRASPVA